jgi:hypothetical protein
MRSLCFRSEGIAGIAGFYRRKKLERECVGVGSLGDG